jgi:hypothetical protein
MTKFRKREKAKGGRTNARDSFKVQYLQQLQFKEGVKRAQRQGSQNNRFKDDEDGYSSIADKSQT